MEKYSNLKDKKKFVNQRKLKQAGMATMPGAAFGL